MRSFQIIGEGNSNDANHLTGPSRDSSGLARAIESALERACVAPSDIEFVQAHGTGTAYNDRMESLALRAVFGDRIPPFNSFKGMIGHTLGAAGILETILCVIGGSIGLLPGTPGLQVRDPEISESALATPKHGADARCILKINSRFWRDQCGVGVATGGRMNCMFVRAASYIGPDGYAGNATVDSNALVGTDRRAVRSLENDTARPAVAPYHDSDAVAVPKCATVLKPWPDDLATAVARGEIPDGAWSALFRSPCPRFGRMDGLSRLGLMAVELLGVDFAGMAESERRRTGICMETHYGCLATDQRFLQTHSPSVFTYTLPSTAPCEICIRHRLQGPVVCLMSSGNTERQALEEARRWIETSVVAGCICMSCETPGSATGDRVAAIGAAAYLQRADTAAQGPRFPEGVSFTDGCRKLCVCGSGQV